MTDRREFFVERGSRRLFVVVRGEGPALFYAHGLAGTHADAGWLAPIAEGFTLITPDLFGRGASFPASRPEDHLFREHADDTRAILDHVGCDSALVGGTSFGAAVATAFAVACPERVEALILLACAFGPREDASCEGDLSAYGKLAERMAVWGVRTVAEQEAERVGSRRPIERWTQHDDASLVAWMRAVPLDRPIDRFDQLEAVTAPALIVPGTDEIHRPQLSEAYAAALADATLVDGAARLGDAVGTFLERFRGAA